MDDERIGKTADTVVDRIKVKYLKQQSTTEKDTIL